MHFILFFILLNYVIYKWHSIAACNACGLSVEDAQPVRTGKKQEICTFSVKITILYSLTDSNEIIVLHKTY